MYVWASVQYEVHILQLNSGLPCIKEDQEQMFRAARSYMECFKKRELAWNWRLQQQMDTLQNIVTQCNYCLVQQTSDNSQNTWAAVTCHCSAFNAIGDTEGQASKWYFLSLMMYRVEMQLGEVLNALLMIGLHNSYSRDDYIRVIVLTVIRYP